MSDIDILMPSRELIAAFYFAAGFLAGMLFMWVVLSLVRRNRKRRNDLG